ncbi:MAG: hypothetical protein V3U30_01590, partial [Thermoplasmata archaeon]
NGLRIGGIVLGGMALFWSFLLFGIYSLLAVAGGGGLLFLAPLVGFGAGSLSIVGGILGVKRARIGATLVLAAGGAGLLAAAAPLFFLPQVQVDPLEVVIAYLAVGWWAILMVPVGGFALLAARREAGSLRDAAPGP